MNTIVPGNLPLLFIAVGVELLFKNSGCSRTWLAGAGAIPCAPACQDGEACSGKSLTCQLHLPSSLSPPQHGVSTFPAQPCFPTFQGSRQGVGAACCSSAVRGVLSFANRNVLTGLSTAAKVS